MSRLSGSALLTLGVAVGLAAVLERLGRSAFEPYFGSLDPVAVTGAVVLAGGVALGVLRRRGWFGIWPEDRAWWARVAIPAAVLAVPVILVDVLGGFPPDINVPWPRSLLFYPLMGLVAECVFHVIPLGLASAALPKAVGGSWRHRGRWAVVGVVCLIEPVLQVLWGSGDSPTWASAYVAAHVLVINGLGLYFFRRDGFVSMYVFRLVYYVGWHVAWGAIRIPLLFGG